MGKARTQEQKEINQKQRGMQREIYERLGEEGRKEFIEKRRENSQSRVKQRKAVVSTFQECVKQGLEYAQKNYLDIKFFRGVAGMYGVAAAAILKTGKDGKTYYQVGYSFQRPADQYSLRIAKGLTAYRVRDGVQHPYQFRIGLSKSGGVNIMRMRSIIAAHIQMDVLSARIRVPSQVGKAIVKRNLSVFLESGFPKKAAGV